MAQRVGADVLHIKGPAIAPELAGPGRTGSDADVLVRPRDVGRLQAALSRGGWKLQSTFEWGSPFGHAATYHHPVWGYLDLHRNFPGIALDPAEAFEVLWQERASRSIAAHDCWVPSITAQSVILVLNAARSGGRRGPRADDVDRAWSAASDQQRRNVVRLVDRLGADVAFAAGIDRLERFRGHPEYRLWLAVSRGGTRFEEWWGRVVAAPNLRLKVAVALRSVRVNRDHLATRLGRPPTRRQVVQEFAARPARGVVEQARAVLQRLRGRRTA